MEAGSRPRKSLLRDLGLLPKAREKRTPREADVAEGSTADVGTVEYPLGVIMSREDHVDSLTRLVISLSTALKQEEQKTAFYRGLIVELEKKLRQYER